MALRQPHLIGSEFARVGYPVRAALTDPRGGGYLLRGITESNPRWTIKPRPELIAKMTDEEAKEADIPLPPGAIGCKVYQTSQMGKVTPETRILRG